MQNYMLSSCMSVCVLTQLTWSQAFFSFPSQLLDISCNKSSSSDRRSSGAVTVTMAIDITDAVAKAKAVAPAAEVEIVVAIIAGHLGVIMMQ